MNASAFAALRPAYGDEVNGLAFVDVCRESRLAGFAGEVNGLGIGARSLMVGGRAPSPALRSVQAGLFPTAFIRALVEMGGAAHGLSRDVIPTHWRARPSGQLSRFGSCGSGGSSRGCV
jgi:hypothetical protein